MIEAETRDVLGLVPCLEHAHALVQHVGLVQRPERDVALPARHDLVAVQRVELCSDHRVYRALGIGVIG